VVHLLEDVDFVLKANFILLCEFSLDDDLNGDFFLCGSRATLSHASKTSFADDLLDLVVSLDI